MIQITAQMRILVAVEPVDFRCGIDGLAALCRQRLQADPFCGTLFVFRNRKGSAIRVLAYDSQPRFVTVGNILCRNSGLQDVKNASGTTCA